MARKYYLNGNFILVQKPELVLIRMKPYGIYPINEAGVKILQSVHHTADLEGICRECNADTESKGNKLLAFLDLCMANHILTNDAAKQGKLSVKAPGTTPYLERLFFEITDRCNLNCNHCYMSASYRSVTTTDVPLENIKDVIAQADKLGVYRTDFTGGEIFSRDDIDSVLKISADHFMITNIFTNGTLINESMVNLLADLGNIRTVFVSLDDVVEKEHDIFRGMRGAFSSTIQALHLMKEKNIKAVANITLSKRNINRIQEIIDYCRNELQIECRTAPILYVGRGKCFEHMDLTLDEISEAMKISLKNRVKFTSGYCEDEAPNGTIVPGCGVGHKMLYVRSNGEMCLCPTLSSREADMFNLGNIYQDHLKEVWEESRGIVAFRESACKNRNCKNIGVCLGGCRSRAYLINQDLCDVDPILCNFFKEEVVV
ncbi:radical SAM/SPASM domain-containing protein [Paenibacillus camerounensis]|uniref:radical SAM/SPASM domain-containing protein n=1 Tax=Paenibacillus camerounensis TaxID=1243663 RepID=UPI0005A989C1|nr:radical SAM protein [Paenibacillus camerounensis]